MTPFDLRDTRNDCYFYLMKTKPTNKINRNSFESIKYNFQFENESHAHSIHKTKQKINRTIRPQNQQQQDQRHVAVPAVHFNMTNGQPVEFEKLYIHFAYL